MKMRTKTWLVTGVALLLAVGLLGGVKAAQIATMINAGKSFSIPPESVTSTVVEEVRWEATRDAIGTLVAARGVTLAAELPGTVREIGFESGTLVRKGTVLVRLDTTTEEAQLASAEADASLARIGLERAQALRRGEASSQADLDAAEARAKQAQAAVAVLRAAIDKKTVRAPFDGRIAIRQVELGQVLQPGSPIASLQSVSPVHADFWLPQQALAEVRAGQKARIRTDAFPGARWEGQVSTVNTEVDVATRNVRVRATFANPDGRLRPGMFANVEVVGAEKRPVLAVPATAVLFAPYGDSVFVLEEKKAEGGKATTVARQTFVRLGERRGDFVAVASGLRAGDAVVSSGAFKLRNGAAVAVHNDLAPEAQLAPRPVE
ncbi:MAG TPA: efflux RND transporter periplasmic adaptor subunit [Anaeromyxobacteraceae bacterium]|jgi:membrane fusion protein (multidrug efflux system)